VQVREENFPPGELADQKTVPVGSTPLTEAVQVMGWPMRWLGGPQETEVVVCDGKNVTWTVPALGS